MSEATEKAETKPKKEAKAEVVLVSAARKPQVFNVAKEPAIHLMPGETSRAIAATKVNFEIKTAEKRGDILVKKL